MILLVSERSRRGTVAIQKVSAVTADSSDRLAYVTFPLK